MPLRAIVRTMRPRQFIKNGVVFLALIFTVGHAWQPGSPGAWLPLLLRSCLAFSAFCGVAAGEYLINDAADAVSDRHHPAKRLRPVASGELSSQAARSAAVIAIAAGIEAGIPLGWRFTAVLIGYGAITLAYTYALKHIVLVDVLTVAAGFVLRAIAGALAIGVPVSPWLYICTALGALLLAVNKRRHELLLLEASAAASRRSLQRYSLRLLDCLSTAVAAATIAAYSLYTFRAAGLPHNHALAATIPFVVFGVLRYLFLVHRRQGGGAPDELIVRDTPLLACLVLWACTAGAILARYR